jgi:hypothetical protein
LATAWLDTRTAGAAPLPAVRVSSVQIVPVDLPRPPGAR